MPVHRDDESTDLHAPMQRPRDSERSPESLTRPNLGAPRPPPPLEEALTFDDDQTLAFDERGHATTENEVADIPTDVSLRPPVHRREDSIAFSFSMPLGPNDTIIPTRPRGNVSAYDALIRAADPKPIDISAFPDPSEFEAAEPEDAPTQDRAPRSVKKAAPPLLKIDLESTQSLSGDDLEILGQTDEGREASEHALVLDTRVASIEPAYEIEAGEDPYAAADGNATLVPSKAQYARLVSELGRASEQSAHTPIRAVDQLLDSDDVTRARAKARLTSRRPPMRSTMTIST